MTSELIKRIEKALQESLPGKQAQNLMLPSQRVLDGLYADPNKSMPSGVLLLLFPIKDQLNTVLIHRSSNGPHGGQISLPGGKKEQDDQTLVNTALRETREEIGVSEDDVRLIGSLSSLYVPHSNFCIHPFVGWIDYQPLFRLDPVEVVEIISVSVEDMFAPQNRRETYFQGQQYKVRAPYYNIRGHKLWGATAMIMSEFELVFTSCTF